MANELKKAINFLLQPRAVIFGVAVFLLMYIDYSEQKSH